jgi:DNA-binding CsgD family transcriptional regulator
LLEREEELAAIAALLAEPDGAVVAVEGAAGIGKTELLAAAAAMARERGAEVLTARGGELERDYALGVARQLFAPVAAMDAAEREEALAGAASLTGPLLGLGGEPAAPALDPSFAEFHGLYWLTVNLASRKPLLLVVDDAHWADAGSLRWLGYLAKRLDGVPAILLVASRPNEPNSEVALLEALSTERLARTLRPAPLSPDAAADLLAERFGRAPDAAFGAACHEVTGGNPFFLRRLVDALEDDGIQPIAADAERVRRLGPETISRSIVLRLAHVPEHATALARAVAILLGDAELRHAAALAELDAQQAAEAADLLTGIDILRPGRPLAFAHPVVRAAIYEDLPEGDRARRHAAAARLLRDVGAPAEAVAAHCLAAEPAADPEVVETLREAAAVAFGRGATDAAVGYLERALAEPPDGDARTAVLVDLGRALARSHSPEAAERLGEALELETDPRERARIAHELGLAKMMMGGLEQAIEVFDQGIGELGDVDRDLALRLEVELIGAARFNWATRPLAAERLARLREELDLSNPVPSDAELRVLANLAFEMIFGSEPVEECVAIARRALGGGRLLADVGIDSPTLQLPLWALCYSDAWDTADEEVGAVLAEARRQGSALGFSVASVIGATVAWRRGDLAATESSARDALDSQPDAAIDHPLAIALLVEVHTERGELDESLALLERNGYAGELPEFPLFTPVLFSRGRLALARGHAQAGIDDLRECGRRALAFGSKNTSMLQWRVDLALALAGTDPAEAQRLIDESIAWSKPFGAPRAIGISLRGQGLLAGGDEGIALVEQAVTELERSGAQLEYARALVDRGAALRRAQRRRDAREPLKLGLDLAHRCGSTALTERAREELLATGARPRRQVYTGLDALTASERRVAEMAANGMTNREIAQALFVTVKTVETHLGRLYRKLDVSSRRDLAAALAAPAPD